MPVQHDPGRNAIPDNFTRIKLRNFGPVSKGVVELKPLTIFLGPNNSGKSYVATLIHSIVNSMGPRSITAMPDIPLDKLVQECILAHKSGKTSLPMPAGLRSKMNRAVRQTVENNLVQNLKKYASANFADLIQHGRQSASFEVQTPYIMAGIGLHATRHTFEFKQHISDVRFNFSDIDRDPYVFSGTTFHINALSKHLGMQDYLMARLAIAGLLPWGIMELPYSFRSVYFPVERSGLLKNWKPISAGMIRSGLEPKTDAESGYTPITAEFIHDLIVMQTRQELDYADIARKLEKASMRGEIVAEYRDGLMDLTYRSRGHTVSMSGTSSSVAELASLILHLKYTITPKRLLIIEEPESNLDLNNQRILAKFIVRLIRGGLRILITTHSPFMVEQLSNFVQAEAIDRGWRAKEFGYDGDDYLNVADVGAYVFHHMPGSFYEMKAVPVTKSGIPQDYFIEPLDSMYEESYKLEKLLSKD